MEGQPTFYVRSDGSDENDGLSDAPGGAFATREKAFAAVEALEAKIGQAMIVISSCMVRDVQCSAFRPYRRIRA